jgi:hypothetical protein
MKFEKKCNCCEKQLQLKQTHIDHVIPLAGGGTNDTENLQILCKERHFEKAQQEKENHEYVRTSETASTYNTQVYDIINSLSSSVFSFVETCVPQNKNDRTLYKIDLNRSRKNAVYHSMYDFPLFTVMDQVQIYKPEMFYDIPG